ncbi:MAG TPA: M23 family metallopeptidase [Nocardioides sp.]
MNDRWWVTATASLVAAALLCLTPAPAFADDIGRSKDKDHALELQRHLQDSRAAHDRAVLHLEELRGRLAERREQSTAATEKARDASAGVDKSPGVLDAVSDLVTGNDDLDRAHDVARNAEHLQAMTAILERGVKEARRDVRVTAKELATASTAAQQLKGAEAARASARLAREWSTLPADYRASNTAQDQRNRRAIKRWHAQLSQMAAAELTPPTARELEQARLPGQLRQLRDRTGRVVPGAAIVRGHDARTFEVVPDTTVRVVSTALASLGVRADENRSCAEFLQQAWGVAQVDVPSDAPAQWESLTAVSKGHPVVGDVVFFRRDEGHGIGIHVGGNEAVALDEPSGEVAVVAVPSKAVLAVRRVTLSPDRGLETDDVPDVVTQGCEPPPPVATVPAGGPAAGPAVVSGLSWNFPVDEGRYVMSAGFGNAGTLWSSGRHTGQDFAAPMGTPVRAAAAGRVSIEQSSWAGQLVRIDHGGGLETLYAHMSRVDVASGATLEAGTPIGAVGSEGNSTGPHLHFEVRSKGVAMDPMPFLSGRGVS